MHLLWPAELAFEDNHMFPPKRRPRSLFFGKQAQQEMRQLSLEVGI